jgi:hypothetical protein
MPPPILLVSELIGPRYLCKISPSTPSTAVLERAESFEVRRRAYLIKCRNLAGWKGSGNDPMEQMK